MGVLWSRGSRTTLGAKTRDSKEGRGEPNPPTPTVEVIGEIGRTPIPVAESTHHPGEKPLPSLREHEGEELDQTGESAAPAQGQEGTVGEA